MNKHVNINSFNSGKESLSRHLSKTSTKNSHEHNTVVSQAQTALAANALSLKTSGMQNLFETVAYKTPFLEMTAKQIEDQLIALADNKDTDCVGANKVFIDKKPLTQIIPSTRDTLIVSGLADMVVDAHLGKVPVPIGFRHSSAMRTLKLVENKPAKNGDGLSVALPFVFASGSCHCCSTGSWRHTVDNLLLTGGLSQSKLTEVLQKAVMVGNEDASFQELLTYLLDGEEENAGSPPHSESSEALLTYLFSSQRALDETRMFMPVARLFSASKNSKNSRHQRRWSVEWHCLTCWTNLASGLNPNMAAQLHSLIRIEDMINILKTGVQRAHIRSMWQSDLAAQRHKRAKDITDKVNEAAGKGQTPTGFSTLKPADVRAMIDEISQRCDTRSPEVKKVLYWNSKRKQLELKTGSTIQDLKGLIDNLKVEAVKTEEAVDDLAALIGQALNPQEEE